MVELSQFQLDVYALKILNDYDAKTPSGIFKDKISISIEDALRIQSAVTNFREQRGEEVIGYKIGCVSKDTQLKMGFTKPAWGRLWKDELYLDGVTLEKVNFTGNLAADRNAVRDSIAGIRNFTGLASGPISFCAAGSPECRDGNKTPVMIKYTKGGKNWKTAVAGTVTFKPGDGL